MEYFIFVLFYSAFSFANVNKQKSSMASPLVFIFFAFIITFFIGLRGIEEEYTKLFIRFPEIFDLLSFSNPILWEKGYIFGIVSSTIRTFGGNSQALLLIFAFAAIFIHAVYYRKFTKYYFVAFLIYISHEMIYKEWSGIRLGLASALVLPCIYSLKHNKKGWFFFWVFMGAGIHYVGILSIFIYWLQKRKKTSHLLFLLIISVLLSQTGLIKGMLLYMSNTEILPRIIKLYLYSENYSYYLGISHPKILQQIVLLLIALYLQNNKVLHQLPYFTLIFNVYFLSTISYILLSETAIFSARIGAHFYSVEPILLIFLAQRFLQKRFYLSMLSIAALAVSYLNYVYRGLLPPYQMFTNTCIDNVC